ncbi:MAG TPA: hypothetical protein H9725_10615 [Candidatus Faecalibacterium gallistercoris]|uniref:Phage tail tape measure protein n=1 Tax=Candidatus Faecalibacterium gallistercoris TaxID=2838579 RepID=A0A9D2FGX7_9FIRM|nr:hypothetical protein [Candidatus Faecalibacterium gallistercoris]
MNLFDLTAVISADTSGYEKGVKSAAKSGEQLKDGMDDLKESTGKVNEGFTVAKGVLSNLVSGGITRAFDAFTNLTSTIVNLDGATEEHRIAMGRLNTAYEAAGYGADVAKQAYTAFYGIIGDTDTATEASQLLSQLARSTEDVATWTDIAAGVSGTFGDSLPVESLIEAANETSRTGVVVGTLADALNWATQEGETFGVQLKANTEANKEWNQAVSEAQSAEDYFNLALQECSSEAERNKLIMDTLSGTYSDASAAFYENNAAIVEARENQVAMQDSMSKLGEAIGRLKTAFATEFTPSLVEAAEGAANFVESIDTEAVSGFLSVLKDLSPVLVGVSGGLVAMKGAMAISAAFETLTKVTAGATTAFGALNMVIAQNPFVFIVTVIASAVTAIGTLIATNEDFRASAVAVFKDVSTRIKAVWTLFSTMASNVGKVLGNLASAVKALFSGDGFDFSGILNGTKDPFREYKRVLAEGSAEAAQQAASNVQAAGESIVTNAEKNAWILSNTAKDTAGDIQTSAAGAASGVTSTTKKAVEQQKTLFEKLKESFETVADALSTQGNVAALEFEVWENAFENTATDSEVLAQKLESLNAQQDKQRQTVQEAKKAYDQIVEAYGEASSEATSFRQTLLQEVSAFQELQKEIDETTISLQSNMAAVDRLQALQEISSLELQVWTNGAEDTATTAETLQKKLDSLTEQEKLQTQVVDAATEAYRLACEQYGETSDAALEYKKVMLEETEALQNIQKEAKDTTKELETAQNAFVQLGKKAESALDATKNFASALSSLGNSITNLQDAFKDDSVELTAQETETLNNKLDVLTAQYRYAQSEVDRLTDAFNESVEQTGVASEQTLDLADQLDNAQSEAESLKNEIDSLSETLNGTKPSFGNFISNIGSSINTVLNLVESVSTLIQTIGSLGKVLGSLGSGGGILSSLGSMLGLGGSSAAAGGLSLGSLGALGLAAGVTGVSLKGTFENLGNLSSVWDDSDKSLLEKIATTLWDLSPAGSLVSGIQSLLGGSKKQEETTGSVGSISGSLTGSLGNYVTPTTSTSSGVTTTINTIEKVEFHVYASDYDSPESLAEAISIQLQNLTERKVSVFA